MCSGRTCLMAAAENLRGGKWAGAHRPELELFNGQIRLARLDLRQIEDVIDEVEQMPSVPLDVVLGLCVPPGPLRSRRLRLGARLGLRLGTRGRLGAHRSLRL